MGGTARLPPSVREDLEYRAVLTPPIPIPPKRSVDRVPPPAQEQVGRVGADKGVKYGFSPRVARLFRGGQLKGIGERSGAENIARFVQDYARYGAEPFSISVESVEDGLNPFPFTQTGKFENRAVANLIPAISRGSVEIPLLIQRDAAIGLAAVASTCEDIKNSLSPRRACSAWVHQLEHSATPVGVASGTETPDPSGAVEVARSSHNQAAQWNVAVVLSTSFKRVERIVGPRLALLAEKARRHRRRCRDSQAPRHRDCPVGQ
jgi:hypothetical protein